MNKKTNRIWLIDFIRGIAIIMVVLFHLIFNLKFFYEFEMFDYKTGFWFWFGRIAAIVFMLMVGVATATVVNRKEKLAALKINLKRVGRLLGISLIISIATLIIFPGMTIWFGILHLMGTGILLSLPLARLRWVNVIAGVGILFLSEPVGGIEIKHMAFLPFGITPNTFASLDYYPLIPWLGVILIGNGMGNLLYKKFVQLRGPKAWEKGMAVLGKNSLWIYLVHQPILLGVLWVVF